ncbi:MAG: hypothetical protein ACJA04_000101 [Cellvibrionaceae bacterium]|jgi:uncharacterized protein (TIGR01777 family)
MHFLITGGTGFIGVPLIELLLVYGHQITLLARNPARAKKQFHDKVKVIDSVHSAPEEVDVVINLAGEPIIDKRWTKKRKKVLKESRIGITQDIIDWLSSCKKKPEALISGSAIGYYGNYPESLALDEEAKPRTCFASELCREWEAAASQAEALGIRVCTVRTGIVLAKHGGALKRMWLPFNLGLGGPIASGNQWFSWIHLEDMVRLLLFLAENKDIQGPVNATAPMPVSNANFSHQLARVLHRPACLRMPALVANLLFGEASELLLEGQKVVPKKLQTHGFQFHYPQLEKALRAIVDA